MLATKPGLENPTCTNQFQPSVLRILNRHVSNIFYPQNGSLGHNIHFTEN